MNEYGGYLPLECRLNGEYWAHISSEDIIRLNSGRNAIAYALQSSNWTKVYIPCYICHSVIDICDKLGMAYVLYHIDEKFNPKDICVHETEGILIVNYFGLFSYEHLCEYVLTYQNVIIDNTQGFFSPPILSAYNVYSCRKFIGVADGAYLIKAKVNIQGEMFDQDISSDTSLFLLKSLEYGTNHQYLDYLQNEERINRSSIKSMSKTTIALLNMADYDRIQSIRVQNYDFLHERLGAINLLNPKRADKTVPMVYPLLIEKDTLRSFLVQNRIYVPQWWKWILDANAGNDFENLLSKYLLPIPIDQRYSIRDMKGIINILLSS